MSDLIEFFALLAAIYLLESFHKSDREGVFLTRLPFGKVKLTRTDKLLSGRGKVYYFGFILPFADTFYLRFPSISFSNIGVFPFFHHTINSKPKAASLYKAVTYEEISDIKNEGNTVYVNGRLFYQADSVPAADLIIDYINKLSERNELSRDNLLNDILEKEFSVDAVNNKLKKYLSMTIPLKATATFYFIYLFILLPMSALIFDLAAIWPVLLTGIIIFNMSVVLLYRRVHRYFYPNVYRERNFNTMIMILSPPVALRAVDFVSKDLFYENNYNVVSSALLSARDSKKILSLSYGDLTNPFIESGAQSYPGDYICIDFKNRYMKYFMDFVKKIKISLSQEEQARSFDENFYCPRCFEYYSADNLCLNCGLKLNKIEKTLQK